MWKKAFSLVSLALLIISAAGCQSEYGTNPAVAYVSASPDSTYEKTFKELHLGTLFDYTLELPYADSSWVRIWVEGYREGKLVEQSPLAELSYGNSPNQSETGQMGWGIIKAAEDKEMFLLYAHGITMAPVQPADILSGEGVSNWDYAIGDEKISLQSGETKLLAVYREAENQLHTYDLTKEEEIKQMIQEDKTVLLLKIKVEKRGDN
ncbi:hypothetical protein LOK74_14655 [Brevibacillus humidisoli]|uniref:hypothetical protein n=1 Tax=Brevibacillus humidisoli TaxID=2895522 RepID=UPI001E34D3F3|nr:hypothetical protein [Brevibacillus humidisoli]UFJ39309.1 hypothetical protein LOK74_14655 [Brevibacillus humidisoli]